MPVDPDYARVRPGDTLKFPALPALRVRSARQILTTGTFGDVALTDYIRFFEIPTRHHCAQMPTASETATAVVMPEPGVGGSEDY